MHFGIFDFVVVDSVTHIFVGLVRGTAIDSAGFGQFAIQFRTNGSTGIEVDLDLCASLYLGCQSQGYGFRIAGRGEAGDTDVHVVLNVLGSSFGSRDFC